MVSADTNLFLYAANPDSPNHRPAGRYLNEAGTSGIPFVTCELVLVEIYMQLRNPAVLREPLSSANAAGFCEQLRRNPRWQHVDYEPAVSKTLWAWARSTEAGFRRIIDARLALTLRYHGVTELATANPRDFAGFGFNRVWNPLLSASL